MCGGCLTHRSGRGRLALRGPRLNRLWTGSGTRRPALRQTLRDRPLLARGLRCGTQLGARESVAIARRRRAQPGEHDVARLLEGVLDLVLVECHAVAAQPERDDAVPCSPQEPPGQPRVQSTGLAGVDRLLDLGLELRDQLTDPGADARPLLGVDVGSVGLDAVESEEAEVRRDARRGSAGRRRRRRRPVRAASTAAGRRCAGSRRRARPPADDARYSPSLLPKCP